MSRKSLVFSEEMREKGPKDKNERLGLDVDGSLGSASGLDPADDAVASAQIRLARFR